MELANSSAEAKVLVPQRHWITLHLSDGLGSPVAPTPSQPIRTKETLKPWEGLEGLPRNKVKSAFFPQAALTFSFSWLGNDGGNRDLLPKPLEPCSFVLNLVIDSAGFLHCTNERCPGTAGNSFARSGSLVLLKSLLANS